MQNMLPQSRPKRSHCKHIHVVGDYTPENIVHKSSIGKCEDPECYSVTGNLWTCLHRDCLFVGCAGNEFNHVLRHFEENQEHCIVLDLNSLKVFCYLCKHEIFLENNYPPLPGTTPLDSIRPIKTENIGIAEPGSDSEDDESMFNRPRGLTGLKNLGNTCYINAALQSLSNCPPLTRFFLDCSPVPRTSGRDNIARSYNKLMNDIWHKQKPSSLVPDVLVSNFKESSSAHWLFGNYNQQDSQEFLRYFMDALHEELKEPLHEFPVSANKESNDVSEDLPSDTESTHSDMEYESCESGSIAETFSSNEGGLSDTEHSMQVDNKCRNVPEVETKVHKEIMNWQQALVQKKQGKDNKTGSGASGGFMKKDGPGVKKKPPVYHSIISDIFDGKIVSSVQCLTCDTISSTKETFQDLSLPIPSREQLVALHSQNASGLPITMATSSSEPNQSQGWISWGWSWIKSLFWGPNVTLHDCLAAFFSADELKGDNMYSCGKCKKLRNGIKYSRVVNLPEVLCIHLKRFRNDLTKTAKISNHVSFPLENLDLSPYMHKDSKDQVTSYELNAVICHYGSDSGCGHYTSYATNTIDGDWYEFDDEYVTKVLPEVVVNCESYVLFYRKSCDEVVRRRDRVVDLMKRSIREPGLLQFYISKQWINKFNTFAEPGPISNLDFLCPHGCVHPFKASHVEDMCIVISQSVWEYLYDTFGGGPVCNHLFICSTCHAEKTLLEKRQQSELQMFMKIHKEFKAIDKPTVIYAISMPWFREWETFVKAKNVIVQPPGPIDNSKMILHKGNQQMLKQDSDYGQLSEAAWNFMHAIYGGGPQIVIKLTTSPTSIVITQMPRPSQVNAPEPVISPAEETQQMEL